MAEVVKAFKSYDEQVGILVDRGMDIEDREFAISKLHQVSYYRLSGYWYPFRKIGARGREDTFYAGTRFEDVVALYDFDARLRAATFAAMVPVELAVRTLLGHGLGQIDPCSHLDPALLGPTANSGDKYRQWLARYNESGFSISVQFALGMFRASPWSVEWVAG